MCLPAAEGQGARKSEMLPWPLGSLGVAVSSWGLSVLQCPPGVPQALQCPPGVPRVLQCPPGVPQALLPPPGVPRG